MFLRLLNVNTVLYCFTTLLFLLQMSFIDGIVWFYITVLWMELFTLNWYWDVVGFSVRLPVMTDNTEETMEVGEIPSPEKVNSQTSLLDSGEDFELLDEDDIGDEPPPLEDTGGGKEKITADAVKVASDTKPESQERLEEWLDVLGMQQRPRSASWYSLKIMWISWGPGNDLLKKKVLEAGEGRDSRPQKGQNVKVNLKTYTKDGELVAEQPELCFTLGDGDVIQVKMYGFNLQMGQSAQEWGNQPQVLIGLSPLSRTQRLTVCVASQLFSGCWPHRAAHGNGRRSRHPNWCKIRLWYAGKVRIEFLLTPGSFCYGKHFKPWFWYSCCNISWLKCSCYSKGWYESCIFKFYSKSTNGCELFCSVSLCWGKLFTGTV